MEFKIQKRAAKNIYLPKEDIETARKFATAMYKEFGNFIQALVVFGSAVKEKKADDIDILVVLDDLHVVFSQELVETYRIVTEKITADVEPKRLHIQSMKLSSFWEYIRNGDPVAINILRGGLALIDNGFFDPLQTLLEQGRIRPSDESVWTYFTMAPASLVRSKEHLLIAAVDLYWSAIDSAHAALMKLGEIPPSPDHVADLLDSKLVGGKHINSKYASTMRLLYGLFKKITHREIREVSGKDYDNYRKLTEEFVNEMKKYIEKK